MPITINGSTGISGVDGSAGTPALQGTDTNTGIAFGSDVIIGSTGGTERFRCDSSGRMLVGASTSVGQGNWGGTGWTGVLQVSRNDVDGVAQFTNWSSSASLNGGTSLYISRCKSGTTGTQTGGGLASGDAIGRINFNGSDGSAFYTGASIDAIVDAATSGGEMPSRLVFSTTADGASSPTERMRIDNAGVVMIGGTATEPGDNNTSTGISFKSTGKFYLSQAADGGHMNRNNDGAIIHFRRSGTQVGAISVTTTATSYATSSDYRLKENVVDLDGAVDRIKQLAPKRFNFLVDANKTVDGFIAHEVQAVVPEAISGEKDAVDDNGNPIYQGIDQSKLVPLLTAALQEAVAKIESLETRLAALEVTP